MKADFTHTADLAAIVSTAPAIVLAAASHDSTVLLAELASATTTPDRFSKLPTSVVNAFITDFAMHNKAKQDFNEYISSAAALPEGKSLLKAVYTAAPTSIQSLYRDPMGVVVALEASATPVWASDIPAPLRQSVGAVHDSALRIYEADRKPTKTHEQFANRTGNSGYFPSGTGYPWAIPVGTGYPNGCPTCQSCTPVTVYTTPCKLPV